MELKLKKGLDLNLAGAVADTSRTASVAVSECAVIPDDFHGFIPKPEVKEGDQVARGQALLHDKNREEVKIVSPASGTVKAVVRGERRKIERVVIAIEGDREKIFDTKGIDNREKALTILCDSGLLSRMRTRPYDIVPDPEKLPRDIFVTAIDSAPLAPGFSVLVNGKKKELEAAVALLKKVTTGKVYLSVGSDWQLGEIAGAEHVVVSGKHPAGNVGVQIANIAPVNKGETVWTLDAATLVKLGILLTTGKADTSATVALTGSEVKNPHMISTVEGAQIAPLIKGELSREDHVRIISGNVLTGVKVSPEGYLHFPYRQITVIPEGDNADEFMGWASLSPSKMSVSRSFPGHFLSRLFKPDARIKGGRRAMIMSEEYDKVIPMDIMAEYLIKAIIAKDIEQMEKLGIYEVAPEDFALAEYVDTSKIPLQQIVRDGLDYLRKEVE